MGMYYYHITKNKNLIMISYVRDSDHYIKKKEEKYIIKKFNKNGKLIFDKIFFLKKDYFNGCPLLHSNYMFRLRFKIKSNGNIYFPQLLKEGVEICKLIIN